MSPTILALLGYAAWTLLLVMAIAGWRTALTLSGRRAANSFGVSGEDVSPLSQRLCRAHANCYENLPIFAAIAAVALATDHAAITDPLALWVLAARVAQSLTHIVSTSHMAVSVRFAFFAPQLGIQAWWAVALAQKLT